MSYPSFFFVIFNVGHLLMLVQQWLVWQSSRDKSLAKKVFYERRVNQISIIGTAAKRKILVFTFA